MKITHNKVGQNLNVSDSKSEKTTAQSKVGNSVGSDKISNSAKINSADGQQAAAKVELSSRAQDIKQIKELASKSPDVDMEKVEKFKKLIADGKYKVDAKAVADKMVDEHMKTKLSKDG